MPAIGWPRRSVDHAPLAKRPRGIRIMPRRGVGWVPLRQGRWLARMVRSGETQPTDDAHVGGASPMAPRRRDRTSGTIGGLALTGTFIQPAGAAQWGTHTPKCRDGAATLPPAHDAAGRNAVLRLAACGRQRPRSAGMSAGVDGRQEGPHILRCSLGLPSKHATLPAKRRAARTTAREHATVVMQTQVASRQPARSIGRFATCSPHGWPPQQRGFVAQHRPFRHTGRETPQTSGQDAGQVGPDARECSGPCSAYDVGPPTAPPTRTRHPAAPLLSIRPAHTPSVHQLQKSDDCLPLTA